MATADAVAADLRTTARVRLRTLTTVRWVAILGQIIALAIVTYGLGYQVPLLPASIVVGASVLLNIAAIVQGRSLARLGDRDAALYLGYDLVQLTVLLFLTGGLENPFAVLLLAPLTVAASTLERRPTLVVSALTLGCILLLAVWHYPLPPSPDGHVELPPIYNLGVWFALTLASLVVSGYVWQVAEEARRMGEALAAIQTTLAREQRLSALGGLAAAAAHELGTPLGTISLVAGELARDLPPDSPIREDVDLLVQEAHRCRDILAELARRPETGGGDPYELLTLRALVEAAADRYRSADVELDITLVAEDGSAQPIIRRTPELLHGLGNLLHNALRFADRRVSVRAGWNSGDVTVTIIDDGPGFPPALLPDLGEPYLFGREQDEGGQHHMGLGLFIAKTLLERGGAALSFSNTRSGGAQVVVRWDRHMFHEKGSPP
ncbi:MAG: ActS/PrrB/RegB family redox-sensitive histidine kinase [Rhodospirillaceae bacterium]|nr:ActS/PrrB/RegB family redox-sensitive histidine kinase [Rhodospirillaceae bacterium]